jgi:hypothetical protein
MLQESVPIAARARRRAATSKHAEHVSWSSIVAAIARLLTVLNIKRLVRNVLRNYFIRNYSKSLHLEKNVPFV